MRHILQPKSGSNAAQSPDHSNAGWFCASHAGEISAVATISWGRSSGRCWDYFGLRVGSFSVFYDAAETSVLSIDFVVPVSRMLGNTQEFSDELEPFRLTCGFWM